VVAKPVGTRTPEGSWEIISPKLAFLPPTDSTSVMRKSSKGTTRAVSLKRSDMQSSKVKTGLQGSDQDFFLFLACNPDQAAMDN
jgi:hypothetical protein